MFSVCAKAVGEEGHISVCECCLVSESVFDV
jgi:hypothetical protein